MLELKGQFITQGSAYGPAFWYERNVFSIPCFDITKEQIPHELARLKEARKKTKKQLLLSKEEAVRTFGPKQAKVFDIQIALLDDPYLEQLEQETLVKNLKNAEACLDIVSNRCLQKIKETCIVKTGERYLELEDVTICLIKNLLNYTDKKVFSLPQDCILFAEKLEPSDVMSLKDEKIVGLVLTENCFAAHAVILARGMNIPIVLGADVKKEQVSHNTWVQLDSKSGAVVLNPVVASLTASLPSQEITDPISKDGVCVDFWLTSGSVLPAEKIELLGAKGIGLFRSEEIFLNQPVFLSEEEQFQAYKDRVMAAAPYPIVLRTLDIGGDKTADIVKSKDPNPFLGLRAIRYCLKHQKVFKTQLRAMLRASAFGSIRILYPMISGVMELIEANTLLEQCKKELQQQGIAFDENVPVGCMIEIPSAVCTLDQLAPHCQFWNVGTNDLVQYTLAMDRTNSQVSHWHNMAHPAILRSLKWIVDSASNFNQPVCLCGEMAGLAATFLICLGLGFRSFSIYEDQIPYLKQVLHRASIKDLSKITEDALLAIDAVRSLDLFTQYLAVI